jgi:xanthine/CO dehydrogenase XdhC/CoxF family maturation factor
MSDLINILNALETLGSQRAALATLVHTQGSSYRKTGARLLIRADGSTVGAISGGCLEHDVAGKARNVIREQKAALAVFDMTAAADELWGYGQGCNGVLSILVEPLTPASIQQFDLIRDVHEQRIEGIIATITRVQGELNVAVGSRLLLSPAGAIRETVKHPFVLAAIAEEAERSRYTGSHTVTLPFTEGSADVFFEVVQPPISLLIAGAGTDAIPVHRMAKELGWQVTVLDHRSSLVTKERFPMADSLIVSQPEKLNGSLLADNRSAAVVMTHQIHHDLLLIPAFLDKGFHYVGLLGPKHRKDAVLNRLEQQGVRLTADQRAKLFGPIGLNIGAESPEEIAVAIIAEIQAVMQDRPAGFLRDGKGM